MKLGDLFIKLGLKSGEFEQGINKAKGNVTSLGKVAQKAGTLIKGMLAGFTIFATLRSAFNTIKDFEQANSTLAATLGKTTTEIKGLTDEAIKLGIKTNYTASQVLQLQTELAKLGFSEKEISKSSNAILDLAMATGADLASAAKIAGSAIRAFNMDASEMERVASVLAVATTKSALSIGDYETALSTVAPVAKTFGFSIEETVALIGKLKDAGFDASSAGTALRNILLNLADGSGKLSTALGKPIKSFDELIPALIKLRESGVDLNQTLQLTDKRSVAAFNQFLAGAEKAKILKGDITDVAKELREMVNVKTDTLAGAIERLKSAWEGLVLTARESSGLMKREVEDLTNSLLVLQSPHLSGWEKFNAIFDITGTNMSRMVAKIKKIEETQDKAAKAIDEYSEALDKSRKEADAVINKTEQLNEKQVKHIRTIQEIIDETKKLEEQVLSYNETQSAEIQSTLLQIAANKKLLESLTTLKKAREENRAVGAIASGTQFSGQLTARKGQYGRKENVWMSDIPPIDMSALDDMTAHFERTQARAAELQAAMIKDFSGFNEQFTNLVADFGIDVVSEFGAAMGELLATGEWSGDFGNGLLQSIGRFASTLGSMLIALGVASDQFKILLGSGFLSGGIGLIAAGAALVAIGGGISGYARAKANGGSGGGGSGMFNQNFNVQYAQPSGNKQPYLFLKGDNIFMSQQRNEFKRGAIG